MKNAWYQIGRMYEKERGVRRNIARAAAWYRKAAEQGLASAQISLAGRYRCAQRIPQDGAHAVTWHREPSCPGNANVRINFGILSDCSRGPAENQAEAARDPPSVHAYCSETISGFPS